MIVHSAGHIVDEALHLLGISPDILKPIKANHGRKPFVTYAKLKSNFPTEGISKKIEAAIDDIRKKEVDITVSFVTKDTISEKARVLPPKLPEKKSLRVVQFGDVPGLPDGGTLVKNSGEIPPVEIVDIHDTGNEVTIEYVVDLTEKRTGEKTTKKDTEQYKEIELVWKKIATDFSSKSAFSYDELKGRYLGSKGLITDLLKKIGEKSVKDRPSYGMAVNKIREAVERKLERLKESRTRHMTGSGLSDDSFDVTAPFAPNTPDEKKPRIISRRGSLHPLTSVGEKAIRIFGTMGYHVVEPRLLDNDYNAFEALNIPEGHPARDLWDTFWTESNLIPIPHTSAMQNRILSSVEPPIREIIVGKCFRNEATDASHEHTFYQLEGVYAGEDITLTDLIGTLSTFMNVFYGKEVKYTIQPSYFPFVEPGLEFLIECLVCGQKGCPFCHYSKWVEIVPCGPIHPNVLREAHLDPERYTGFAWGLGLDRLVILRNQISDIRMLHSGDLKFLEQFA